MDNMEGIFKEVSTHAVRREVVEPLPVATDGCVTGEAPCKSCSEVVGATNSLEDVPSTEVGRFDDGSQPFAEPDIPVANVTRGEGHLTPLPYHVVGQLCTRISHRSFRASA